MRKLKLMLCVAVLSGCSKTVLVPVPPRVELKDYPVIGVVEFDSNADAAINQYATRQLQEHIQAAQPGTRFIELGRREAILAAVGAKQLDVDAFRKIGSRYGVAAVFVGSIHYSDATTDVKLTDLTKLEGSVRSEMKGDASSRLVETKTGASVWGNSAWVRKQLGRVSVSTEYGVSGSMSKADPRHEMVPTLVYHLTQDFRPRSVRQAVK